MTIAGAIFTFVSVITIYVSSAIKQFYLFGDAPGFILAIRLHSGAGKIPLLLQDRTQTNAEHTPSRRTNSQSASANTAHPRHIAAIKTSRKVQVGRAATILAIAAPRPNLNGPISLCPMKGVAT